MVYNIPKDARGLAASIATDKTLPDGTLQWMNDFRRIGYGGPCPPGGTHRYFFKLYALDAKVRLKPGAAKPELLKALKGHVLAEAVLMDRYRR